MEKSIIGRKYEVKDNSYAQDLTGTCVRPHLCNKTCIIITQPYIKEVNGRRRLFVDVVVPDNPIYTKHYSVLFFEWGLLDKEYNKPKASQSTLIGCTYYSTFNYGDCRLVSDLTVTGVLAITECVIISEVQTITLPDLDGSKTHTAEVLRVRSQETGMEYYVPYIPANIVNYKPDAEPQPWKFCPYCGKPLH